MNQVNSIMLTKHTDLMLSCEQYIQSKVSHDQPSLFHLQSGGSRTRAKICIDAGLKLNLDLHDIICIASTVELLHNASLIHDDVQDEDAQRRGRPSVWKKFGKAQAICSGDIMLSAAYSALADINTQNKMGELIKETHRAVAQTISGQSRDLMSSDASSVAEYESIAAMKSGPLFRIGLSLPLIIAGETTHIKNVDYLSAKFAIAYQINDDLSDWQQDKINGQLNLINILTTQSSINDSLFVAKERARYLLRKCQKEILTLPNNCGSLVAKSASILMTNLENDY